MMKLGAFAAFVLAASNTGAFSPSARTGNRVASSETSARSFSTTSLNLFGSKNKEGKDGGGQPGMMDQLAMFKKAQEIASKKASLDKELASEEIVGSGADGKVMATVKYVPPQLPASPTPGFETSAVDIDEGYLAEASAEEISAALVEAIRDGEKKSSEAVAEKYKSLEEDMKGILGGMGGVVPGAQ